MPQPFTQVPREVGTPVWITPGNPAVASQWQVNVPANEIWMLQVVTYGLAAGVGTRTPNVGFYDSGGILIWHTGQPTSFARPFDITFGQFSAGTGVLVNARTTWALPGVYISNGSVRSIINVAAGDQLQNIRIQYQRWTIT